MSETKIRVEKAKLIEAIKDRKAECVAAFDAETASYQDRLGEWVTEAAHRVEEAADLISQGKRVEYGRVELPTYPSKPSLNTSSYDRHIAMLEMSPDDTVSVNTTDFGVYLR